MLNRDSNRESKSNLEMHDDRSLSESRKAKTHSALVETRDQFTPKSKQSKYYDFAKQTNSFYITEGDYDGEPRSSQAMPAIKSNKQPSQIN